jgi:hypothetical protein
MASILSQVPSHINKENLIYHNSNLNGHSPMSLGTMNLDKTTPKPEDYLTMFTMSVPVRPKFSGSYSSWALHGGVMNLPMVVERV